MGGRGLLLLLQDIVLSLYVGARGTRFSGKRHSVENVFFCWVAGTWTLSRKTPRTQEEAAMEADRHHNTNSRPEKLPSVDLSAAPLCLTQIAGPLLALADVYAATLLPYPSHSYLCLHYLEGKPIPEKWAGTRRGRRTVMRQGHPVLLLYPSRNACVKPTSLWASGAHSPVSGLEEEKQNIAGMV